MGPKPVQSRSPTTHSNLGKGRGKEKLEINVSNGEFFFGRKCIQTPSSIFFCFFIILIPPSVQRGNHGHSLLTGPESGNSVSEEGEFATTFGRCRKGAGRKHERTHPLDFDSSKPTKSNMHTPENSGDCGSVLVLSLSQPTDKEAERGEKPQVPAGDLIARGVFDTESPSKRPRALRLSTVKTGERAWLDSVNTAQAQEIAAGRGYSWK
uniref:Uncharacterized protein n=1 Tax=Coccidioides posadasii RMSCC 3488 TaxID=454284 RepID=A0A0J6FVT0_COCPO|nr:hypothetical protein CPAG_09568 [Coccidioides posadasii RMSCC 3488]